MRIMPFMKRKKGLQFAGIGLDTGGGGGGGSSLPDFSTDEQSLGIKWIDGKDLFIRVFHGTKSTGNDVQIPIQYVDTGWVLSTWLTDTTGVVYFPYHYNSTDYFRYKIDILSTGKNIDIISSKSGVTYDVILVYTKIE